MRLLACLDFSEGDAGVLLSLRRLARAATLQVRLLHVAAEEPAFVGYDPPGGPHDRDRRAAELRREREALHGVVAELAGHGIAAEARLVAGSVVPVVLAEAEAFGAELILLGARQRSRVGRLLQGSVLRGVLDSAHAPVLIAERAPDPSP